LSAPAIDRLIETQRALVAALDSGHPDDIERATALVQAAVDAVRTVGSWHADADLRERLRTALATGDAARMRTGYHADRTRRRLAMVASLRRPAAVTSYGRNGGFRMAGL
jgi:phage I-like protein